MKSVTEFASYVLTQGLTTKTTMATEGKTPEEIQAQLGQAFKLEGDKLKYFFNALEVAGQKTDGLGRVLVLRFEEGENVPSKATKIEDLYYVPEFRVDPKAKPAATKADKESRGRGGKGRSGGGQKESPWGLSPEQKAAKKGAGTKAKTAAAAAPKTEGKPAKT